MREIRLTKGAVALVDDEDYERVARYRWHLHSAGYAGRSAGTRATRHYVLLHRFILDPPSGVQVDHADMDKLNNQRSNLRLCTRSQNLRNTPAPAHNTSGTKGVWWDGKRGKWTAQISILGKVKALGRYVDRADAEAAYAKAAQEIAGEFARL